MGSKALDQPSFRPNQALLHPILPTKLVPHEYGPPIGFPVIYVLSGLPARRAPDTLKNQSGGENSH